MIQNIPPAHQSSCAEDYFFPLSKSFNSGYVRVSDPHEIYYQEFGNPEGLPVVVLHGGPGVGCTERSPRIFDPNLYRIIVLDQRGASKSKPHGELKGNTIQELIHDLEVLRQHLDIEDGWLREDLGSRH